MNAPVKRALVTGGSGDIGAAIAKRLAEAGHAVILHANRHLQQVDALAQQLMGQGRPASTIQFDLRDPDETRERVESLLADGPIQIIVNNAGIHEDGVMAGMDHAQWQAPISVILNGFFHVTQPLLLPMIRTRWGRIVNISSVAGILGNRGQTNYAAAKAGLIGASKSLALELASRQITVNVVAPGIISGGMAASVFDEQTIRQLVPMQRAGKPEDVADLVEFLCSERADYITNQVFSVNGGMI